MSRRKPHPGRKTGARTGTPAWVASRLLRHGTSREFVARYLLIETHAEAKVPLPQELRP